MWTDIAERGQANEAARVATSIERSASSRRVSVCSLHTAIFHALSHTPTGSHSQKSVRSGADCTSREVGETAIASREHYAARYLTVAFATRLEPFKQQRRCPFNDVTSTLSSAAACCIACLLAHPTSHSLSLTNQLTHSTQQGGSFETANRLTTDGRTCNSKGSRHSN